MSSRDDVVMMAKLMARMSNMLETLTSLNVDVTCCALEALPKCHFKGCQQPATIKHDFIGILACDECCARAIVKAGHLFTTSENDDSFNEVRGALLREDLWHDVPSAERIRRLTEFRDTLKKQVIH